MSQPDVEPEERGREFSSPASFDEDDLIEKLENVVLKSDENHESVGGGDGHKFNGGLECTGVLPLRPYAGDCPHHVRTGMCKFGLSCRYNHPTAKKTQQFIKSRDMESENSGTIECKYFTAAGGCRYGKSCKYSHPGEQSEVSVPELNFLGLPMRLGEKECEYYMRNGSCSYGSRCVYHHPDPSSIAGKGSPNSMDNNFSRRVVRVSENGNGGSLHMSGASQPYQAPWSPRGPLLENRLSPQWMGKQPELNGYQTSSYPHQSRSSYSAPIVNGSVRKPNFSGEVDEYPERPGQPECDYFMKTGCCKFKYTCRFHHPKNRTPKPDEFVLSEEGLPLRPGRSICRHFERLGFCKFGPACLFDHPVSHGVSTYPDWSASRTAVTSNGGGCED